VKTPDQDNLRKLLERFMSAREAEAAAEELRAGEEILRAHPAPEPDREVILGIKLEIASKLSRKPRIVHRLYRFTATAAAVIVVALLMIHGRAPQTDPSLSHAALVPTFIWESDDLSADDMQLAYLTSEIEQIEAQVRALEAGEDLDVGTNTLDEVEMELMHINIGFWKE
jgi:hypothetical protein